MKALGASLRGYTFDLNAILDFEFKEMSKREVYKGG